jgi:hypothetical protein
MEMIVSWIHDRTSGVCEIETETASFADLCDAKRVLDAVENWHRMIWLGGGGVTVAAEANARQRAAVNAAIKAHAAIPNIAA